MADKEKKKKTKKKEEPKPAPEPAATPPAPEKDKTPTPTKDKTPTPAAAETPKSPSRSSRESRGSRKIKRSGSSIFSAFTQKQVAEFKEGFALMDHDKDGILGKEDLAFIFDQVGKIANDKEIEAMLEDSEEPLNFTQMLTMFAGRMQGDTDDDQTVINAFMKFDKDGKIDGERFRHSLITFGEKFSVKDCNEAFDHFYIDDKGRIDTDSLINMLTGKMDDED